MLKGLLKMSMLKIISENKATGYEIIKKIEDLTGEKPSTGSVYPLLKAMEKKGWIVGRTTSGKTTYEITDSGHQIVQAHGSKKKYYEHKINESITLAQGTFGNLQVTLIDNTNLLNQVTSEVSSRLAHGVTPEKINAILSKTIQALQKLE